MARSCPSGAGGGGGFVSRAPPPGRALNTSTLPPVKCYRCGGPNHVARYGPSLPCLTDKSDLTTCSDCLAPLGSVGTTSDKTRT